MPIKKVIVLLVLLWFLWQSYHRTRSKDTIRYWKAYWPTFVKVYAATVNMKSVW